MNLLTELVNNYLENPSVDSLHRIEDQWNDIYSDLEDKIMEYSIDDDPWKEQVEWQKHKDYSYGG